MRHFYLFFILIFPIFSAGSANGLVSSWNDILVDQGIDPANQSFCVESKGHIEGINIDKPMRPASVTKLYTTLWSLDRLGKDFTFKTQFIIDGDTLYIKGDRDPFYVTENLMLMMSHLYQEGYTSFKNVYFDHNFFLNWSDDPKEISRKIYRIFNTRRWNSFDKLAYLDIQSFIERRELSTLFDIPNFSINSVQSFRDLSLEGDFTLVQSSPPMWKQFKQVNMFSNNFYTDHIFNRLGGTKAFQEFITKRLNTNNNEIYFYTGSGLGDNYTTCHVTLKMLNELKSELQEQGLIYQDIIAMPGVDQGTLYRRFTEARYARRLAAKTGTLSKTSALAGYLFLSETEDIHFAILNSTSRIHEARESQNIFIKYVMDSYDVDYAVDYETPDFLAIEDNMITQF